MARRGLFRRFGLKLSIFDQCEGFFFKKGSKMLPFLKRKEASVASNAEDEALTRKSDEESESYDILDAVSDDMLEALEAKNKSRLKSALQSLCDYIMQEDEAQDESLINKEG